MSDNGEIRHKIPMLVQGKLSPTEAKELREVISDSEELQQELEFWQGINNVRNELPLYDHSERVSPELLDAYVRGELNPLSAEYSQLQAKLQDDKELAEDAELLRQALRYLPEESAPASPAASQGIWERLFGSQMLTRILVPITAVLIVALAVAYITSGPGSEPLAARIALKMQNEKRSVTASAPLPELPVLLRQGTKEVIFTFPTDRVEVPSLDYDLTLQSRGGESLQLSGQGLECIEQALTNLCELKVDDPHILASLKRGGSFVLEVREEFPEHVSLVPAEYEYYFRVELVE